MSGVSVAQNKNVQKEQSISAQRSDAEFFVPLDEAGIAARPLETVSETQTDQQKDDQRSAWLPNAFTSASVLVSLIVHLNLILLLAAIFMMLEEEPQTIGLISSIAESEGETDQLDSVLVESLTPTDSQEVLKNDMELSSPSIDNSSHLSHADHLSSGSSMGDGKPSSGIKMGKAGFFGAQTRGNSFVFVVDNSGSMNGERFRRAVAELIKAINGLDKDQKFYILFYNSVAVPMPFPRYRKLVSATDSNKRKAITWINRIGVTGGTMPQQAVVLGLNLKPQVMFFLTDGMMPRGIRTTFQEFNKRSIKTIVHTIAFQSRVGEPILQGIAVDNKGRYRYVE